MRAVTSIVFHLMMFPHEGKIVMVDHITYHDMQGLTTPTNFIPAITTIEPQGVTTHANVIPAINTMVDNTPAPPLLNVGPGLFVDASMMAHFSLVSPPWTQNETADLCMVSPSTAAATPTTTTTSSVATTPTTAATSPAVAALCIGETTTSPPHATS